MGKINKEFSFITKITCIVVLFGVIVMNTGYSRSSLLSINFTAISEALVSANPIAMLIGSVLGSIALIVTLVGKIKEYLQRRSWNKKYGESRTPVVINANDS